MNNFVFNKKYYVFLISAGRTGTKFFGHSLNNIIENSFSVHEPDVLKLSEGLTKFISKIKTFGFYHMLLGRFIGQTGVRNLSQKYLSGKLSLKDLERGIIRHRNIYYCKILSDLIIESYSGWYGCIPAIKNLYYNYKLVIITRDPRDWIVSNMNWETLFGKRDWVSKLNLGRLNPKMVNDKEYKLLWDHFSRFQKICWTYKFQYETMINNVENDPNALVVKFEDLFYSHDRYKNLSYLLDFITDFENKKFKYVLPSNILDKKINKNISYDFPYYEDWNLETKKQFDDICSSIMKKLNYA